MNNNQIDTQRRSIMQILQETKKFIIPEYQRPYAWGENECTRLWEDIWDFAIPNDNHSEFKEDSEYFLGCVVLCKNENGEMEVIDGQQRLTTFILLLRALYDSYIHAQDKDTQDLRNDIGRCIWQLREKRITDTDRPKIESKVSTGNAAKAFNDILLNGTTDNEDSLYTKNYKLFQGKILDCKKDYNSCFDPLVERFLVNCTLLKFVAESRDTALQIFSTLNNRGLSLSDSDIFKAELYKFYSSIDKKDEFVDRWKSLEELCCDLFKKSSDNPMDEIFTRYMYYERAKRGIKTSTTIALRKFYEDGKYSVFKNEETFTNIEDLAQFWNAVDKSYRDRFSEDVLKRLYILRYAPNSMWTYFVSVYYLQKRDIKNEMKLDDKAFVDILDKLIAIIWAYAIVNPGVSSLRAPLYEEMVNIVKGNKVSFANFKFEEYDLQNQISNYSFTNARAITKSMLTWWAFHFDEQELLEDTSTAFDIEHIYAIERAKRNNIDRNEIESLGNKSILEKRINIRASDYTFEDKKAYYKGDREKKGKKQSPTKIHELITLCEKNDFNPEDIEYRTEQIINGFVEFLKEQGLVK